METRTCSQCGTLFEVEFHSSERRTCSGACAGQLRWINRKRTAVTQICFNCGKEFLTYNYLKSERRYCSLTCRKLGRVEPCCVCGKPVYKKQAHLQTYSHVTCSKSCAARIALGNRYESDGFAQPHRNFTALRKQLYRERGRKCEVCGSTDDVHAHHKEKVSKRPDLECDPDNIILLCKSCHSNAHGDEIVKAIILAHKIVGRPSRKVPMICVVCGTEKMVSPWYAKRHKACSRKCGAVLGKRAEYAVWLAHNRKLKGT